MERECVKDEKMLEKYKKYDMVNYVHVEKWIKIGEELQVPGKVVNSLRARAAAQRVNNVNDITDYIWQRENGNDTSGIIGKKDIWDIFSDEQVEELMLLYLQKEKGMFVYTSTVKRSEMLYECIVVDERGNKAYPQAKSGTTPIDVSSFKQILDSDSRAKVYLFQVNDVYDSLEALDRVIYLNKTDIEQFMRKNSEILAERILDCLDICGFWKDKQLG